MVVCDEFVDGEDADDDVVDNSSSSNTAAATTAEVALSSWSVKELPLVIDAIALLLLLLCFVEEVVDMAADDGGGRESLGGFNWAAVVAVAIISALTAGD